MSTPWSNLFIDPDTLLGCRTLVNFTTHDSSVICDDFFSTSDSVWGMLQTLSLSTSEI